MSNKALKKADNQWYSKHKKIREWGYPKYDNYDAIEVSYVNAIPCDYKGVMGVPISFMNKYCPEQFEIIWLDGDDKSVWVGHGPVLNGKVLYRRLFIKYTQEWIKNHPNDFK